jgi:peptidoglycan/LPS O-acetylase OafA/YrhL
VIRRVSRETVLRRRAFRRRSATISYEDYRGLRYFPALDGLRAVSILLVLTWHANSILLGWLSGAQGVAVFFVISGFLITTLSLREEDGRGFSLVSFYIRRTCRIFPLYFLVLGVYVVAVIGFGWAGSRDALVKSLPYYLTYANDLSPYINDSGTPFTLSWSLGVEEKFYLFWPLLAFVVLRGRVGFRFTAAGVFALATFGGHDPGDLYLHYGQIFVGCLLALALHTPATFRGVATFARRPWLVLAAFLVVHGLFFEFSGWVRALYAPAVALVIAAAILADPPWARVLRSRLMVFVGQRAYGVYLVQMICLWFVVRVVQQVFRGVDFNSRSEPFGAGAWPVTLLIFLLGTLSSLVVADVLYRTVERRFIAFGRASSRRRATRPVGEPAEPVPSAAAAAT